MKRSSLKRIAAGLTSIGLVLVGASMLAGPASAITFAQDYSNLVSNSFTSTAALSPQCPNAIAATPGSAPASKILDTAANTASSFTLGGTVYYTYLDNTATDQSNFVVQDCEVSYPASVFAGVTIDPSTGLVQSPLSKQVLDQGTAVDGADLIGFPHSSLPMHFGWKVNNVNFGDFVCNFARDISNGHTGEGNRKAVPVCFQVQGPHLTITKTVDKSALPAGGGSVVYTIAVKNDGTAPATSVVMTDPTPSYETFVSATASDSTFSCVNALASGVTCTGPTLAAGATETFTIKDTIGAAANGSSVMNVASATATNLPSVRATAETQVGTPVPTTVVNPTTVAPNIPTTVVTSIPVTTIKQNPSVLPDVTPTTAPPTTAPPTTVRPTTTPPTVAGPTVTPVVREVLPVTASSPSAIPTRVLGENGQRLAFTGANVRLLLEVGLMLIVMGMGFLYAAKRPGVHSR